MKTTLLALIIVASALGGYCIGHQPQIDSPWVKVGDSTCRKDGGGCWVPTQELSTAEIPSLR